MFVQPRAEHEWLAQMVGHWEYESECSMGPGQPPQLMHGRLDARLVGGLWLISEGSGSTPDGTPMSYIVTVGFDTTKGHYVGSFLASCMDYLWSYEGRRDESGQRLPLHTRGPNMLKPGELCPYQDVIEVVGPNEHHLTSLLLTDSGEWMPFLKTIHRRVA